MRRKPYITSLENLIDAYYNLTLDYGMLEDEALIQLSARTSRKLLYILIQKLQLQK